MELCSVSRKVPASLLFSLRVSQRTRSVPVSLRNDSVCVLPRPDQEPSGRHATAVSGSGAADAGWGVRLQPASPPATQATASAAPRTLAPVREKGNDTVDGADVWALARPG